MKLGGRVAFVTGTSCNIGGGIAEELAREGAAIVAVDAVAANALDCAAYIQSAGGRALGIVADLTSDDDVTRAVNTAIGAFDRIDILINNIASFNPKGVLDMTLAEWNTQIRIILDSAFLCTKHVALSMIAKGISGSIINIISTAGHQGEPGNVAYGTAKMGLRNFTNSVAMELAHHGIRVNALTPTATDRSEAHERALRWGRNPAPPEPGSPVFIELIPMQRLPKPSDYGKAAVFLASDDASMITGIDLRVDGGAIAKYWAWNPGRGPR